MLSCIWQDVELLEFFADQIAELKGAGAEVAALRIGLRATSGVASQRVASVYYGL